MFKCRFKFHIFEYLEPKVKLYNIISIVSSSTSGSFISLLS